MVELILASDSGQGQPLIILAEADDERIDILPKTVDGHRVIFFKTPRIQKEGWPELSHALLEFMDKQGIKQSAFVGLGDSSAVIQHIALCALKRVRRIILVNARTRPHPSTLDKVTDWIESKLPLGLPLRSDSGSFNSKPFLHRLRCPCLVVLTSNAGAEYAEQAALFNDCLPTAWFRKLNNGDDRAELLELVTEFQDVPAKRSQKNL